MEQERRTTTQPVELRQDPETRVLSGYAALYDVETVIAGVFREKIAPGAFRSALARPDDVRALFNHDPSMLLGRTSNGTLRLTEDDRGLRYEVDLNPEDPDAQRVLAKIARGDVSQSSFGFIVRQADPFSREEKDRLPLRVIRDVELFDVSPVTYPAYDETTVAARSAAEAAAAPVVGETELAQRRLRAARAAQDVRGSAV